MKSPTILANWSLIIDYRCLVLTTTLYIVKITCRLILVTTYFLLLKRAGPTPYPYIDHSFTEKVLLSYSFC